MLRRGVGNRDGRDLSRERGIALHELEDHLAHVDFPLSRAALMDHAADIPALTAANGERWDLKDLLTDVPVDEFSSPQHVAEVVRLRWEDMADLFRPGGTGPHEPLHGKSAAAAPPDDARASRAPR